jgi:cyclopropane-fatty-acyl-phospholipid synthase
MSIFYRFLHRFVQSGTLTVVNADAEQQSFGSGDPHVVIRVRDGNWPWRVVTNPALAVGEGYMEGAFTIEQGDLESFLEICIRNKHWGRDHWLLRGMSLMDRAAKRLYQYNPVTRARSNVACHYELSVDFFDRFLDSRRQYSCGYFLAEQDDLELAQYQKLRHIAAKLCLEPGMRVLDIGCGWGGLAIYLAQHWGVRVTGITLSEEQLRIARKEALRAEVADRVEFLLCDYREITQRFDRIVSVGMFEHVGKNHYRRLFRQLRANLVENGIALVHSIGRADGPGVTNAWTRKYIFPGGYSPALSEVLPAIERERLCLTDLEVLRLHYARTIGCWLRRYRAQREDIESEFDERFVRMWEFYLASAMMSFLRGNLMVFQVQVARDCKAVPITRDYIAASEGSPLPVSVAQIGSTRRGQPVPMLDRNQRRVAAQRWHRN